MMEIGRVCVKIAGRDAGKHCIIVDVIDKNNVTIDGLTRRRKCNIKHLEPLETVVNIGKNAGHEQVMSELEKLGMKMPKERKKFKEGKVGKRPVRKRKEKSSEESKEKKDGGKKEK